jgi:Ca2+-binding EF-hand superfamily protein
MKKLFVVSMLIFGAVAYPSLAQDAGRGAAQRGEIEARLKAMDTNGDGAIDKAEYLARAEAQFKRLDLNGDGRITADELQKIRERRGGAGRGGDATFP